MKLFMKCGQARVFFSAMKTLYFVRSLLTLIAGCGVLTGLAAEAHAGEWSGPVYSVTGRSPNNVPPRAANRPSGIAEGPDASASASVSATFTWTATQPNEEPPTSVFVVQESQASWHGGAAQEDPPVGEGGEDGGDVGDGDGGLALPLRRQPPSFSTADWHGQDQTRFIPIQQQPTTTGTAGCGLGDKCSYTSSPNGGISIGKALVAIDVTGGQVTVPAVSPSASVTPSGEAQWSYKATLHPVEITGGGSEREVMVGQHIGLSVSPTSIPGYPGAGLPDAVATYSWNVPGETIARFEETAGDPNATPPVPFSGHKVPLTDLSGPSVSFHWINGDFAGEQNDVAVDVTIDGKTAKAKAKFKVFRPRMDSFTGTYTNLNPPIGFHPYAIRKADGTITIVYLLGLGGVDAPNTQGANGITWDAAVSTPSIFGAQGEIAFMQLATVDSEVNMTNRGHTTLQATDALDSATPRNGNPTTPQYGGSFPVEAGATQQSISKADTPGGDVEGVSNNGDFIKMDSRFKTYLVYKPSSPDSMWVTLGLLNWRVEFKATYNNAGNPPWDITNQFPTVRPNGDPPEVVQGIDSTELPEYSARLQDLAPSPANP